MVSRELVRGRERKTHPGPQGWVPVPGPNSLPPRPCCLVRQREIENTGLMSFPGQHSSSSKGKADLNMSVLTAGDEWRFQRPLMRV